MAAVAAATKLVRANRYYVYGCGSLFLSDA